jgi:hypothetical protein
MRGGIILTAGGTQVDDAMAGECVMHAGFGRGTTGAMGWALSSKK